MPESSRPRFGIGTIVSHPQFGRGRVAAFEGADYVVLFRGGEAKRFPFTLEVLSPEGAAGDPDLDRIRQAVREVLGENGWVDVELELGKRWVGGTLRLLPGRDDSQSKDVPIDAFFKKLIGVRDKLRVLEQRINAHPTLTAGEKLELEGYVTRCYGSLTTFNVLFAAKDGQFKGQGKEEG